MMVHNHGYDEDPGQQCPETRMPDGTYRGACMTPVHASPPWHAAADAIDIDPHMTRVNIFTRPGH